MSRDRRSFFHCAAVALLVIVTPTRFGFAVEPIAAATSSPPKLAEQFRRPVALAWVEPGRVVAVANSRSGTISLVDVSEGKVIGETKVGERLSDLQATGEKGKFVALDDKTNELLLLEITKPTPAIVGRASMSADPRRVRVVDDGRVALVACRWGRWLDVVELRPKHGSRDQADWNRAFPHVARSIELPFAPQELLPFRGGDDRFTDQVIVADAFGGRLAAVDWRKGTITKDRQLRARNIRGLAIEPEQDQLFVACQKQDSRMPTSAEALRWGMVVTNLLMQVSLTAFEVAAPEECELLPQELQLLCIDGGGATKSPFGAADPDDVLRLDDGRFVLLLAGSQRVELWSERDGPIRQFNVGSHPTAALIEPSNRRLIVANRLDDTLSFVDLERAEAAVTLSLGPMPELWPRDRGERLFFDGRRSLAGFMSCHSCHTDGHTAGGLADTLGDGSYGTPKRIPTLLGTSITDPWGWNGGLRELRDQVDQSMRTTMHDPHHRAGDADDLTAYLHTLKFSPPLIPKPRDAADKRLFEAGRAVFEKQRCAECHVPPLTFTSPAVYDVGLRDEQGLTKFNPPSLRGVGQGVAFFHDARRKSLHDLFRLDRHQLDGELKAEELRALVRYLQGI